MDAIDAEFVDQSTQLAVREELPAPPALFGSSDPVEIVTNAVRVADALKAVVVQKKLVAVIQGKEYPQVEAWLTLAAMLRLTTVCEWSRRVEGGWEARVFVRDAAGATIGAAEAQCLSTERSKRTWEDYALRSMAQTRATSKALRSTLAFVMVLAGFQPTPAEEMPDAPVTVPAATTPRHAAPQEHPNARATRLGIINLRQWASDRGVAWSQRALNEALDKYEAELSKPHGANVVGKPSAAQKGLVFALHGELQHDDDMRHAIYQEKFGVDSFRDLTHEQATDLIKLLTAALDTRNAEEAHT